MMYILMILSLSVFLENNIFVCGTVDLKNRLRLIAQVRAFTSSQIQGNLLNLSFSFLISYMVIVMIMIIIILISKSCFED